MREASCRRRSRAAASARRYSIPPPRASVKLAAARPARARQAGSSRRGPCGTKLAFVTGRVKRPSAIRRLKTSSSTNVASACALTGQSVKRPSPRNSVPRKKKPAASIRNSLPLASRGVAWPSPSVVSDAPLASVTTAPATLAPPSPETTWIRIALGPDVGGGPGDAGLPPQPPVARKPNSAATWPAVRRLIVNSARLYPAARARRREREHRAPRGSPQRPLAARRFSLPRPS